MTVPASVPVPEPALALGPVPEPEPALAIGPVPEPALGRAPGRVPERALVLALALVRYHRRCRLTTRVRTVYTRVY